MFPHKRQKEERKNETSAHVFSCEFCKIFKSTTPLVISENERDETKLLHMNPNWTIVIFELFLWIIVVARRHVATFFYSRPKVKMRQN